MKFWGIEVKSGEAVKCEPGDGYILHLSQAALGDAKKGSDNALVSVKFNNKKIVLGTLSAEKYPQIQYDLVFEKEFELSHSSKTSVFFSGYKTQLVDPEEELDFDTDDLEDEDDIEEENAFPPFKGANGKLEGKDKGAKPESKAAMKLKAPAKDVKNDKKNEDDSDEDESDDFDEDEDLSDDDDDHEMSEGDSSDEEEDESDEEDEQTPKKPQAGKKRAAETALKTPVSDKKAKIATPSGQKTGDKRSVHVATPHPSKQASKTGANTDNSKANNDKSKGKSPKSSGSVVCKSCSKTFNSEVGRQSHSKAKHGAK